jgi:hypothetical protein
MSLVNQLMIHYFHIQYDTTKAKSVKINYVRYLKSFTF